MNLIKPILKLVTFVITLSISLLVFTWIIRGIEGILFSSEGNLVSLPDSLTRTIIILILSLIISILITLKIFSRVTWSKGEQIIKFTGMTFFDKHLGLRFSPTNGIFILTNKQLIHKMWLFPITFGRIQLEDIKSFKIMPRSIKKGNTQGIELTIQKSKGIDKTYFATILPGKTQKIAEIFRKLKIHQVQ
jgi:hypothetical protein|tara:strand:- start:137 stop:706 length:570 start_codon:yes stop_codon:yes gene_type:complete